jgi:AcrR family transcriptional regulator
VRAPVARTPGRPRSAAADQAILQATLDVLAEEGYRGLTIEAVRARAGVGKATVYRRWSSKEALVVDAVRHLNQEMHVPEDGGSLVADFAAVSAQAVAAARLTNAPVVMARIVAESRTNPDLHAIFFENLINPRRQVMRAIMQRAQERGEIRPDIDPELVVDLVVGPVLYRSLIVGTPMEDLAELPAQVLDAVLNGVSPR